MNKLEREISMKLLILGNGQLGQMLAQSCIQLGHEVLLVNTRSNQVVPAAAHVALPMSIAEAMEWADVVSWEHEQLDPEHVQLAADKLLTDAEKIRPLTHRQLEKSHVRLARYCNPRLGIHTTRKAHS